MQPLSFNRDLRRRPVAGITQGGDDAIGPIGDLYLPSALWQQDRARIETDIGIRGAAIAQARLGD